MFGLKLVKRWEWEHLQSRLDVTSYEARSALDLAGGHADRITALQNLEADVQAVNYLAEQNAKRFKDLQGELHKYLIEYMERLIVLADACGFDIEEAREHYKAVRKLRET